MSALRLALLVALALALAGPAARAAPPSREDLLERIGALAEKGAPRDLCDATGEFLARFPGDPETPAVLWHHGRACFFLREYERAIDALARVEGPAAKLLLGLALAERGCNQEARAALEAVASAAPRSSPRRIEALYALGEIALRAGEVAAAREALGALVAEGPAAPLAKNARADLADLEKIGAPAPPLDALAALPATASPTATVVLFIRRGEPPAAAGAGPDALGPARLVRIEVDGWDDPQIKAWKVPALPWAYVLDGRGVVRAAGARGEALRRAAAEAAGTAAGAPSP